MPRTARVIVPNCPHHIVQRGHNRKAVFITDEDYRYYLSTLVEWKRELQVKVYSYCLMTNHVHLIVDPGDKPDSVGLLMKRLAGRQTRYVNKLEGRSGSLWEGRYKASAIDGDAYLLQCCRYIDLNPVKAGMVASADQYQWSSYRMKVGAVKRDWLDFDECYLGLKKPSVNYRQFVEMGISKSEQQFIHQAVARNQLTGGTTFIDEIEARTGIRIECRKRGRPAVVNK
jgi:putative transposase